MPAITPPTQQMIDMMKDAIKHSKAFIVNLDVNVEINSINNYLIFDDSNKLLHAIDLNSEIVDQATAPFRIRSFDYDRIEFFRYLV